MTGSRAWVRFVGHAICAAALPWLLFGGSAATGQEPIPEPDVVFVGTVTGAPASAAIKLETATSPFRTLGNPTNLDANRGFVVRARLVNTQNGASVGDGETTVPDIARLLVNGIPQGTLEIRERGVIYGVDFAYSGVDPSPLPTLAQNRLGGGIDPGTTPTGTPARTPTPTTTAGSVTATPFVTPTPTPSPTATVEPATPTATPVALVCTGDCNLDQGVTVDELVTMVNVALGYANLSACLAGDANDDGEITIDEIIGAVTNALHTCPPEVGASRTESRSRLHGRSAAVRE